MSFTFLSVAACAVGALFLTGLVRKMLRKKKIIDRPNDRSSHVTPTPRGGGLGLIPLLLASWAGLVLFAPGEAYGLGWKPIIAATLLFAVSWLDDVKELSVIPRLATHFIAVGMVTMDIGPVFQGLLPDEYDILVTTILWVIFLNFYNFMDGIDGITSVETITIGLGCVVLVIIIPGGLPYYIAPGATIAAVAIGFLFWNWHPAKLFMGDSGSIPLGFLCGWLLFGMAAKGHWLPALILSSYYLSDAGLTLVRRLWQRKPVWKAHREHFYQRAVQNGKSHSHVAAMIALTNGGLATLAILALFYPFYALGGTIIANMFLLIWMVHPINGSDKNQSAQHV